MARKNRHSKNLRGPVSTLIILTIVIAVVSLILNKIGFQGYKTSINSGVLEDNLVSVKNIISVDGIRFIIGNTITNFKNFEPLVLLIMSLIGIGICEKSGFLNTIFKPLRRLKFGIVIFITILLGIISTVVGEYSFIFLIPLIGVMYKYLNRNPILGIMVVFLGITLGYGTGLIFNYYDYSLGLLTESAAIVDVDPNFKFNLLSNIYIMIISSLVLIYIMYIVINKFLVPKFPKKQIEDEEEYNYSKKGLALSLVAGLFSILLVAYMVADVNLPFAGILLDHDSNTYIAKLFSDSAPFKEGLVVIIASIMMIFGFVYGKFSGNIKNSNEYSLGLSKNFENLGLVFVLMFFLSQLTAILDWTNLGVVVSCRLISFMSSLQFSGVPLIFTFFIIVILMSILIPGIESKWALLSPTVIPLFMRSNISPEFTQFIFKIADSVGKCFSPIFIYFVIMLAFLEKYRVDDNKQITIFGTLKLMMPTILLISLFWILFVCLWYLIGFPIGPGIYTTL